MGWNLAIIVMVVVAMNPAMGRNVIDMEPIGKAKPRLNDRPLIAVMSQEPSRSLRTLYGNGTYKSYISASYVKFIEMAGARVVPVMVDQPDEYYEKIFQQTNGLLIPGGAASIYDSGYARGAKKIYEMALANFGQNGDYYPIWGTCLGFELLALFTNDDVPNLTRSQSNDIALKLNVTHEFYRSKMFEQMPMDIAKILTTEPVNVHFHKWCVSTETHRTSPLLNKFWNVLATNMDDNGYEFVSLYESKDYPIWATIFHPEKNTFEWTTRYDNIPHSQNAMETTFFFANFFVHECRKNGHRFADSDEESKHLIYNYSPEYTGSPDANWVMQQSYMFN